MRATRGDRRKKGDYERKSRERKFLCKEKRGSPVCLGGRTEEKNELNDGQWNQNKFDKGAVRRKRGEIEERLPEVVQRGAIIPSAPS